jgi:signal transduction histidine kinase
MPGGGEIDHRISGVNEKRLQSQIRPVFLSSRHVPALVILITLILLAAVISLANLPLRGSLREQIARRDAYALYNFWMGEQFSQAEPELELWTDATDYLVSVLDTNRLHKFSQIPSVKGTRLFDATGKVVIGVPVDLPDAQLSATDLALLSELKPVSRFRPAARTTDLSMLADAENARETFPLLEVVVPLHAPGGTRLLGAAQFILDGTNMADEFRDLDNKLLVRGASAFFAVGAILTFVLAMAFHQLKTTNALLIQRTQSLLKANQELVLSAKTSAVGAVTAHLIHGLRNPLSGLQSFMAGRGNNPAEGVDADWDTAISTTQRMQALINETVRVLREEQGMTEYELSLEEIVELVSSKLAPAARQQGVELRAQSAGAGQFNNRTANLIVLILDNLLNNAIQATPSGGTVTLEISKQQDSIVCDVRDQGVGLPDHLQNRLFQPCQSTKPGGTGLGLAISKQLANSFGAELELKSNTSTGCTFSLSIPLALCSSSAGAAQSFSEQTCVS